MPAFNEEHNIGSVIDELRAFAADLEVVVVSDGSVDRTAEVAAEHGAHVVRLPFNLGIGGAVQTGFQYAAQTATTSSSAATATVSTILPSSGRCSRPC